MTGNPTFAAPVPTLATITASATSLNEAIEACDSGLHSAFSIRAERYETLMANMRTLGAYIQQVSNGNEGIITSSGFEVVGPKTPIGLPPTVTGLAATTNGFPGGAELRWTSLLEKADSYVVYATQTDPATLNAQWEIIGFSTKASFTVENLPNRNQYHWFCAVAVNSAGESAMSDPAKCMVL